MKAKKILITLLCVVFCSQYAVASEKDEQSEAKSDESVSQQSILPEDQVTASPFGSLAGRSRIGASFGFRSGNAQQTGWGYGTSIISGAENLTLGFGYAYWLREDLTLNLYHLGTGGGCSRGTGIRHHQRIGHGADDLPCGNRWSHVYQPI